MAQRHKNAYGENIFVMKSLHDNVTDLGIKAVDKWYSEISNFNFQGTNHDMAASSKACNLLKLPYNIL